MRHVRPSLFVISKPSFSCGINSRSNETDCAKTVHVGTSGQVSASIRSDSVVIHGKVEGDIVAKREITLHKSACVRGDMRTVGIVIEPGAKVEGRIVIGSDAEAPPGAPKSPTSPSE